MKSCGEEGFWLLMDHEVLSSPYLYSEGWYHQTFQNEEASYTCGSLLQLEKCQSNKIQDWWRITRTLLKVKFIVRRPLG